MSRRSKPKSPAQILAERLARRAVEFEAVGLQPEAAALATSAAVEVRRSGRAHVAGARRLDAFDALRDGMAPGGYDAARRLEADLRLRRGEADHGRSLIRVDGGGEGPALLDRQLAAGRRVDAALAWVGTRDGRLLCELIYPSVERSGWRETVAMVTGETHTHAQAAAVRAACANLAAAYEVRPGEADRRRKRLTILAPRPNLSSQPGVPPCPSPSATPRS
jgi:hypothetical protein